MWVSYWVLLGLGLYEPSNAQDLYPNVLAEQLNRYCDWKMGKDNGTHGRIKYRGKAGPRGARGPPGPPTNVDYERINRTIRRGNIEQDRKIALLEEKVIRLEEAFHKISTKSCKWLDSSHAKIINETGGVFDIYPGDGSRVVEVYCDTVVDDGGWIVFQRRMDGSEDFERNFIDYETGFGQRQGEFWLGLRNLHLLTKYGAELRVDLTDWEGNTTYAKYSNFIVGDASSQYTLTAGGYSGTAGDSLTYHSGQKFYTKDRDNSYACSKHHRGGMWYKSCYYVNLNGIYKKQGTYRGVSDGVEWYHWKGNHGSYSGRYGVVWYHWKNNDKYSLKFVEMKLRI